VLELVLNDEEKPSIAVRQDTNTNVQAGDPGCPDTDFEMFESTDNIGGDLTNDLKYTIVCPDGQVSRVWRPSPGPPPRGTRSWTCSLVGGGVLEALGTVDGTAHLEHGRVDKEHARGGRLCMR
jgi:hypothetical protein